MKAAPNSTASGTALKLIIYTVYQNMITSNVMAETSSTIISKSVMLSLFSFIVVCIYNTA